MAYHYVTKDKDSENAVTQPTTHGFEGEPTEVPLELHDMQARRLGQGAYVSFLHHRVFDFTGTDSESSTNIAAATQASTSVALAAPSAVPAGNIIGTRDNALQKRGQGHQTQHIGLLAARSMHAHARIHKDLHKLD